MSMDVPSGVRRVAESLDDVPAYVYDLAGLARHAAAAVRAALAGTELCYVVKANPDPRCCGRSRRTRTGSRSPPAASSSMSGRCCRTPG